MQVRDATVSIPVTDLGRAIAWYRAALELGEPDLVPADGIVEFRLGPCWLQLAEDPERAETRGVSVNLSVADTAAERERLAAAGASVTELRRFEGAVELVELTDPDGNAIGFVTVLV